MSFRTDVHSHRKGYGAHSVSELTKLSHRWSFRHCRKCLVILSTGLLFSQFVEFVRKKEDNNTHYYVKHAKLYELSANRVLSQLRWHPMPGYHNHRTSTTWSHKNLLYHNLLDTSGVTWRWVQGNTYEIKYFHPGHRRFCINGQHLHQLMWTVLSAYH
jgi:hypothetical protein